MLLITKSQCSRSGVELSGGQRDATFKHKTAIVSLTLNTLPGDGVTTPMGASLGAVRMLHTFRYTTKRCNVTLHEIGMFMELRGVVDTAIRHFKVRHLRKNFKLIGHLEKFRSQSKTNR
jgi:hypothetical protein